MSTRIYKSGAQKIKKKQRAEEELRKLTKLERFLSKTNKEPNEPKVSTRMTQSQDIHPIPNTEPGTSSRKESTSTNEATNIEIYKPESSTPQKIQHQKTKRMILDYGVI
jgi:hypothetical protein